MECAAAYTQIGIVWRICRKFEKMVEVLRRVCNRRDLKVKVDGGE